MERISVIIPAYNEASYEEGFFLKRVIRTCLEAKKAGVIQDVIVVDDGSTDKTAEIAQQHGATVIRLPKNVGKGAAFIRGLQECRKLGTTKLLTLDADLLNLNIPHINEMISKLNIPINKEDKVQYPRMVICMVYEGKGIGPTYSASGIRGFNMSAFNFLFKSGTAEFNSGAKIPARFLNWAKGYALEGVLNHIFSPDFKHQDILFNPSEKLYARPPYMGAKSIIEQSGDLQDLDRVKDARELRILNKWRNHHKDRKYPTRKL